MASATTTELLLELPASRTLKNTATVPAAVAWKLITSTVSAVILRQLANASANAAA